MKILRFLRCIKGRNDNDFQPLIVFETEAEVASTGGLPGLVTRRRRDVVVDRRSARRIAGSAVGLNTAALYVDLPIGSENFANFDVG